MSHMAYKSVTRSAPPSAPVVIQRQILTLPKRPERQTFTLAHILNAVSEAAWIDTADIIGPWREKNLMQARMAAYYLCRTYSKSSFPRIGQFMGGRDHSTVLNGYYKVLNNPADFAEIVHAAEAILFKDAN
jgi:chromosomal replication initiation ATPase DnaA